jgi:hypothetical protein
MIIVLELSIIYFGLSFIPEAPKNLLEKTPFVFNSPERNLKHTWANTDIHFLVSEELRDL